MAIALFMLLTLGATRGTDGGLVAQASTLAPKAQIQAPVQPLVIERRVVAGSAPTPVAPVRNDLSVSVPAGGLLGSIGYALPYGNCVNQINPRPNGNPSSWPVRSQTPSIGRAALFHYNHVGRVVGIWSNGDLEIAHENYQGGQHRFPRSTFRGFW